MAEMTQPEIAERGAVRGTVAAGGKRLEYEWLGPGPAAAPTLVFLHDGQGCVDTWRAFPAALAAATGCGALVYSRAGYGGSEALPGPWPACFMHDEARAALPQVVAALGVRDGFLVGHSDGASISLIYAAISGTAGAGAAGSWLRGMALEAPTCLRRGGLPGKHRQAAGAVPPARSLAAHGSPSRRQRPGLLRELGGGLAAAGVPVVEHRGPPAAGPLPGAGDPG
jgi:pimeloyl-ACP methyl ester carboxylesterase